MLLQSHFLLDTALVRRMGRRLARTVFVVGPLMFLGGCSVLAVADAAVSVAATAVSVTATVVETTVDVAAAGVRAATADDKGAKKADEGKAEDKSGAEPQQEPAQEMPTTSQRNWQPPEWPANR